MVLGQDIYDGYGNLLFPKGMALIYENIQKLQSLGCPGVYLEDALGKGVAMPMAVSAELPPGAGAGFACFRMSASRIFPRNRSRVWHKIWLKNSADTRIHFIICGTSRPMGIIHISIP